MKFSVTMKCPDALSRAITQATQAADTKDDVEALEVLCARWFRYGECISIEIDTEQKTCVVIPNR